MIETLMDTAHGRYLVLTASGSLYEIDLDQKTLCRHREHDDSSQHTLRRDSQDVELLELRECTVGRRMIALIDLRWERVPSTKQRESQNSSTGTSPIPGIFYSPETILAKAQKELGKDAHALAQAKELYAKQLEQRTSYMLKDKGRMAADWTRRYLIPDPATPVKPRTDPYQGKTVMMKRPVGKEAKDANAGGLKHEQYFPYGSADWKAYYGMRSGVESLNRNIKRSQFENIANPDNRAVRGNTFTYLIATLATMVENLRQMLSFYKRKLAIATVTAKNRELPTTFWQSDDPVPSNDPGQRPPN